MRTHTSGPFRNVVGPQVRKYRDFRGWSQATLAVKCQTIGWDITRDIVATIEDRGRWVGDFELAILARVLAIPVTDLIPNRINWTEMGIGDR